ncbi:MAG: Fe-S cluster assembly protein SufD [Anaerolineae bacterium]
MAQQNTIVKDPVIESGVFTRDTARALSEHLNEPGWMKERRQVAWSLFEELPMPTTSDEDWRRTDIRALRWDQLQLSPVSSVKPASRLAELPEELRAALDEGRPAAGRLALVNGQPVYFELAEGLAEQGVIFTDMGSALREHPDLVQKYFMTECVAPSDGKFAALNGAFWQGGAFIYVPKEVVIEEPFQVVIALEGDGTAIFPHTLIVTGPFASVSLIEETLSRYSQGLALNNGIVEIIAGDGAQVRYVEIQGWGENVFNFNTKRSVHRPDSLVVWETGQLGGRLTKTYVDSVLRGNGSAAEFNGVYFVGNRQHIDLDTLTHHIGLSTSGDLLLKGAARDKARAVFQGMIKIDPTGQQTNSYLKNENLLLSDGARSDSIPSLQIDANDVRASHGATVSRIDEEHVFYLQSRGIPRNTAVRMIVEGFFSSVFDRMGQERVREKLASAVSAKIGD